MVVATVRMACGCDGAILVHDTASGQPAMLRDWLAYAVAVVAAHLWRGMAAALLALWAGVSPLRYVASGVIQVLPLASRTWHGRISQEAGRRCGMSDQQEDPREHIDDWEWLYQHGYLDGTFYGARRRLNEALQSLVDVLKVSPQGRFVYWLADRLNAGLEWLTRRLGSRAVRELSRVLHVAAWLGLLVSYTLLAYGFVRGVVTRDGVEALYFAGWIVIVTATILLFRKWWM